MESTRAQAKAQGYVETVLGRRLWLPEINSPNGPRRGAAERQAINAPLQGTAADIIKLAMIAVQGWIEANNVGSRLIMQVHDELVLEVPEAELDLVKVELPRLMAGVLDPDWRDPEGVVTQRRFFARAQMDGIRVKPDSLAEMAWGAGCNYDPLERIVR
jgi:hypothetical protein